MGRDASVHAIPYEGSEAFEPAVSKESVKDVVGHVAHNIKGKTHDVVEIVKEKAHDAAETIKWQASEVRHEVSRRMSLDNGVLPAIPEEPVLIPMTPIAKDPFVMVERDITGAVAPPLPPRPQEYKRRASQDVALDMEREGDFPREKDSVLISNPVVTMHIDQGVERPAITFWDRASQAQLALEEAAHNMRLKVDGALQYQFGGQADKIQEEFEKTRVSAIAGTAHLAELLQIQFRKASLMLRNQPQPAVTVPVAPIATVPIAPKLPPLTPRPLMVGESKRAGSTESKLPIRTVETMQPIEDSVRLEIGIEDKPLSGRTEKLKETAISNTVYLADMIQEQFGNIASTLREQQQQGIAPVFR